MNNSRQMPKERWAEIKKYQDANDGTYINDETNSQVWELLDALQAAMERVEELEGALKECREAVKYTGSYSTVIGIVNRALEQEALDE